MSPNLHIDEIVRKAAKEIAAVIRQSIAEAKRQSGANGARAARAAAPKAKPAKGGRGRRGAVSDKSLETVLRYVQKNPGKRSEEIQKAAGLAPALAKKALVKLREAGRVKMKGVKRAATYRAA
jgi:hypothetical protein